MKSFYITGIFFLTIGLFLKKGSIMRNLGKKGFLESWKLFYLISVTLVNINILGQYSPFVYSLFALQFRSFSRCDYFIAFC